MRFNILLFLSVLIIGISYYVNDCHSSRTFRNFKGYSRKYHKGVFRKYFSGSSEECDIVCPKYNTPQIDILPFNATNYRKHIERAWNIPIRCLSKEAKSLKAALIKMVQPCNYAWSNIAMGVTTLIWSVLPAINLGYRPNLCIYASLINATVTAGANPICCDKLVEHVRNLFTIGLDITQVVEKISKFNSGCVKGKIQFDNPPVTCYKNGDFCDIAGLLALKGGLFPPSFRCAVLALSKSCKYEDRFMSVVAAVTIIEIVSLYFDTLDKNFLVQIFEVQNVPKIDPRCCDSLNTDFNKTISLGISSAPLAISTTINSTGCNFE